MLAVILRIILSLWRRPRITLHEDPSFDIPEVPVELLRSADQRIALLRTGAPRNAIVAAWLDLETSVAATGLPRDPAETSTEFTERVIGTWDVDRLRLGDLAALYREARFSVHELGEAHRERALLDLETLHADLARVAHVVRTPPSGGRGRRRYDVTQPDGIPTTRREAKAASREESSTAGPPRWGPRELMEALKPWKRRIVGAARQLGRHRGRDGGVRGSPNVPVLLAVLLALAALLWHVVDHADSQHLTSWPLVDGELVGQGRGNDFRVTNLAGTAGCGQPRQGGPRDARARPPPPAAGADP